MDGLRDGVLAAGEALRLNVRRRRHIGRLRSVDESIRQIDYAVRNVRVLARAGVTLSRLHTPVPPELVPPCGHWPTRSARPAPPSRPTSTGRTRPRTATPPGPTSRRWPPCTSPGNCSAPRRPSHSR
ncbi:hypothetical protein NKG94_10725 [Micromonospora sp. M12]